MGVPATTGALRTRIEDMQIGDYIACNYQAASNTAGAFSNLGVTVGEEIPVNGAAVPNGVFYFVKVDKGLLIADRVVQHSISWNTLNAGKFIQGVPLGSFKLPDPDVTPANDSFGVSFSPDGNYLAVAHENSPFLAIYKRNGDSFTKLSNPDVPPAYVGRDVSFSPDGNYLAVAHASQPWITIYKRDGDSFTKLPNPDVLPSGTASYGVSFSPDGNYLAVVHSASPYITIYKRDGDSFTKLPAPDVLPPSTGQGVAFSPDGNYLAVVHVNSPFITIYKRNGDSFTKLPNPDVLPPGTGYSVTFSPDGNYLAVAHSSSPFITIYKRDGDSFTKSPNPDVLPSGTCFGVSFSPDGNYLAVAHINSPCVTIYKRNGDSFTKFNPSVPPSYTGRDVAFSPDGNYLAVAHERSPFIAIYGHVGAKTVRSLTGGVAYADAYGNSSTTDQGRGGWPTNNEWDVYVAGFPADKIQAGKTLDDVFHYSEGVTVPYTWCQDTLASGVGTVGQRTMRGRVSDPRHFYVGTYSGSGYATVYNGFRPVLEFRE